MLESRSSWVNPDDDYVDPVDNENQAPDPNIKQGVDVYRLYRRELRAKDMNRFVIPKRLISGIAAILTTTERITFVVELSKSENLSRCQRDIHVITIVFSGLASVSAIILLVMNEYIRSHADDFARNEAAIVKPTQ